MRAPEENARAFDGLLGDWQVENRMLRERLAGCTTWHVFVAQSRVEPVLAGLGNLDHFAAELGDAPFLGLTVRIYDPATDRWSLRWADTWSLGNGRGGMEPAFVGRFDDRGLGIFVSTLEVDGRTVHARFTWSGIARGRPVWEQAWATRQDGPWETNWTMTFRRAERFSPSGAPQRAPPR